MIILHSRKIIIFRIPKTGSTSLQYSLKDSEIVNNEMDLVNPEIENSTIQSLHTTPQIAYDAGLITKEMISTYQMYATVRDPFDRLMSSIGHILRPARVSKQRTQRLLKAQGMEGLPKIFRDPQSKWLEINGCPVVVPIPYPTCNTAYIEIFAAVSDALKITPRNFGTRRIATSDVLPEGSLLHTLISNFYSEDIAIFKKALVTDSNTVKKEISANIKLWLDEGKF